MKRLLLLCALIVLTAACGGRTGFDDAILGTWEGSSTADENAYDSTWEFFEDGTIVMTMHGVLGTSASFAGTYTFEDEDTITLRRDGSDADAEPGRRDIRMPDGNTLILTAPQSGAQAVLKRAGD